MLVKEEAACIIGKDYPAPMIDHDRAVSKNTKVTAVWGATTDSVPCAHSLGDLNLVGSKPEPPYRELILDGVEPEFKNKMEGCIVSCLKTMLSMN